MDDFVDSKFSITAFAAAETSDRVPIFDVSDITKITDFCLLLA